MHLTQVITYDLFTFEKNISVYLKDGKISFDSYFVIFQVTLDQRDIFGAMYV